MPTWMHLMAPPPPSRKETAVPQAMRQRIRDSRHMWTYDYMAAYITAKVLATAGDPQLDVYYANDTNCEAGNYTTVRTLCISPNL